MPWRLEDFSLNLQWPNTDGFSRLDWREEIMIKRWQPEWLMFAYNVDDLCFSLTKFKHKEKMCLRYFFLLL